MGTKIRWTQEALEQLKEIRAFISLDSPERALTFIEELLDFSEKILSSSPLAGRVVPEISNPSIREFLFKKYRLVYRKKKNLTEILTFFEGHRLLRLDEMEY